MLRLDPSISRRKRPLQPHIAGDSQVYAEFILGPTEERTRGLRPRMTLCGGVLRPAIPLALDGEDLPRRELAVRIVEVPDIVFGAGRVMRAALDLQRPAIAELLAALPVAVDRVRRRGGQDARALAARAAGRAGHRRRRGEQEAAEDQCRLVQGRYSWSVCRWRYRPEVASSGLG